MSDQLRSADRAYYAAAPQPTAPAAPPPPDHPASNLGPRDLRGADVAYYRSRRGSALRPSLVHFHGEPAAPAAPTPVAPTPVREDFPMTPAGAFPLEGRFQSAIHQFSPEAGADRPAFFTVAGAAGTPIPAAAAVVEPPPPADAGDDGGDEDPAGDAGGDVEADTDEGDEEA